MNYYERHIGDYLKDTAHLSLLEHGVYTRLLDVYYTREGGIPEREAARLIGARSKDEREALAAVLGEFFQLADGMHTQARSEAEIARYRGKREKAAASANARWGKPERNANASGEHDAPGMRTHSEGNATRAEAGARPQSPVTSHQSPDTKEKKKRVPALTVADLVADGLTEVTAQGWIDHRGAKGAKLTSLAWSGFKAEVLKAPGWTNEAAVLKAIARNWTGFEAKWVADDGPPSAARAGSAVNRQEALEQRNLAVGQRWAASQETIDETR